MTKEYIRFVILSLILLFIQVVVMNNIRLFSYFIPIIYLYPLLFLPYQSSRWMTTILGAILGFVMDIMMNTPGLNMASATLVGFVRNPILIHLTDDDVLEDSLTEVMRPSFYTLRIWKYGFYTLMMTLIHISSLMLLEAFSIQLFSKVIPHILGSTIVTIIIFFLFEALAKRTTNS